jgi:hypothetical protein
MQRSSYLDEIHVTGLSCSKRGEEEGEGRRRRRRRWWWWW